MSDSDSDGSGFGDGSGAGSLLELAEVVHELSQLCDIAELAGIVDRLNSCERLGENLVRWPGRETNAGQGSLLDYILSGLGSGSEVIEQ